MVCNESRAGMTGFFHSGITSRSGPEKRWIEVENVEQKDMDFWLVYAKSLEDVTGAVKVVRVCTARL